MSQAIDSTLLAPTPPPAALVQLFRKDAGILNSDLILSSLARGAAVLIILMLVSLIGVLMFSAIPSIRTFGFGFLVSQEWRPNELEQPKHGPDGKVLIQDGEVVMETLKPAFGALPVIYGTTISSVIALVIAVPLSF